MSILIQKQKTAYLKYELTNTQCQTIAMPLNIDTTNYQSQKTHCLKYQYQTYRCQNAPMTNYIRTEIKQYQQIQIPKYTDAINKPCWKIPLPTNINVENTNVEKYRRQEIPIPKYQQY